MGIWGNGGDESNASPPNPLKILGDFKGEFGTKSSVNLKLIPESQ